MRIDANGGLLCMGYSYYSMGNCTFYWNIKVTLRSIIVMKGGKEHEKTYHVGSRSVFLFRFT